MENIVTMNLNDYTALVMQNSELQRKYVAVLNAMLKDVQLIGETEPRLWLRSDNELRDFLKKEETDLYNKTLESLMKESEEE